MLVSLPMGFSHITPSELLQGLRLWYLLVHYKHPGFSYSFPY